MNKIEVINNMDRFIKVETILSKAGLVFEIISISLMVGSGLLLALYFIGLFVM